MEIAQAGDLGVLASYKSAFHNPSAKGRWVKQINAHLKVRNA
jgi:hypothetical protein